MSTSMVPNNTVSNNRAPNTTVTSLAVRLARANELNLKRILAKGQEVEDKDILDALVDPLHRTSLLVDEEKGCFVKVENRVDKALERFTPVEELTLATSIGAKRRKKKNVSFGRLNNVPEKWHGYFIDFSLVLALLLIVFYGFVST